MSWRKAALLGTIVRTLADHVSAHLGAEGNGIGTAGSYLGFCSGHVDVPPKYWLKTAESFDPLARGDCLRVQQILRAAAAKYKELRSVGALP
jgi:hypothetical protein